MSEDDDQWRYSVEDFPDDGPGETVPSSNGEDAAGDGDGDRAADESGGNVAGHIGGLDEELEPGTPTLENAFFVVLGAAMTVIFFFVVAGFI